MTGLQFIDVQSRPTAFLYLTSVTLEEFQQLVPPFEAAFQAHRGMVGMYVHVEHNMNTYPEHTPYRAAWRLDGKPHSARQFTVNKNSPLPTPEERLFFILTYLKAYALQVVQGRLFGMMQGKAKQGIHILLPALLAALRTLGDAPTRSLSALAQRRGVAEADVATVVASLEEGNIAGCGPCRHAGVPPLPMPARNDASSVPKTLLNRKCVRAARNRTTR